MASVKITTPDDKTAFAVGTSVKLTAAVAADEQANSYQWIFKDQPIAMAVNNQYEFPVSDATIGKYEVKAVVAGQEVKSASVIITKAEAAPKPEPAAATEPQPVFHRNFAIWAAISVVAVGIVLIVISRLLDRFGISGDDWKTLDSGLKVGVSIAMPVAVLGCLLVLVGLWMALVEWRGRFLEAITPASTPDVQTKGLEDLINEKTIEALGKLRGPALVMLVGALLLVSSAWVAQSAAGSPNSSPEATPAPTPVET